VVYNHIELKVIRDDGYFFHIIIISIPALGTINFFAIEVSWTRGRRPDFSHRLHKGSFSPANLVGNVQNRKLDYVATTNFQLHVG
jgi:hypothetical protein